MRVTQTPRQMPMVAHWAAVLSIALKDVLSQGYDARHRAYGNLNHFDPDAKNGNQAQKAQSQEYLGSYLAYEVLQVLHDAPYGGLMLSSTLSAMLAFL